MSEVVVLGVVEGAEVGVGVGAGAEVGTGAEVEVAREVGQRRYTLVEP